MSQQEKNAHRSPRLKQPVAGKRGGDAIAKDREYMRASAVAAAMPKRKHVRPRKRRRRRRPPTWTTQTIRQSSDGTLRQGEVADRVARDIDDGGRVLWVPSGKTKNARRRLKIPDHLRPLVLAVAKDKQPDELIFYLTHYQRHRAHYYVVRVKRLCRLAGVPEVAAQPARPAATLALEGGATADAVAKALGHSSLPR
ncbi:MAG: hypothetical protein U0787_14045 [Polyangia bacterium]